MGGREGRKAAPACCPLMPFALPRVSFSLCLRSSCSGVISFTGGGIGASGEFLPINFGLGSSLGTGGNTGAPPKLPEVKVRGEFLVGLSPDSDMPCEPGGGERDETWCPLGVEVL